MFPTTPMKTLVINDETLPIIEQISDGMPGGFFIYHADGNEELIHINAAMLRIFGCDNEQEFRELTGWSFRGIVHPDDLDATEASIIEQINTSEEDLDYVEYRIIRKDGEIRWIRDYGHFVKTDTFGDIFYVFIDDDTERHRQLVDERLKAELIEGLSRDFVAIGLLDLDCDIVRPFHVQSDVARALRRTSGISSDFTTTITEYAERFVHPDCLQQFLEDTSIATISKKLEREGICTIPFMRYNTEGALDHMELVISRIPTLDATARAVIGFKLVNEEVKRLREEMERQSRLEKELAQITSENLAKSTFLFNISHDLRTPMTAILGFTDLADKHADDPEELKKCLATVRDSGVRLLGLIDEILDMSQLESGLVEVRDEPCNLGTEVARACDELGEKLAQKQLSLKLTIDINNGAVLIDIMKLRRIVNYLLDNAVKFSKPGDAPIEVSLHQVATRHQGFGRYRFVIQDHGIGMAPEFLARIFTPFERERNSTHSTSAGPGLGLAIVKKLVSILNGTITATSEPGLGATFTVTLDLRLNAGGTTEAQSQSSDAPACEDFAGKRILVVEDNELNREITEDILTEAGFEVVAVESGEEALATMQAGSSFDLILMDIQMPGMDGYETTRAIRALPGCGRKQLPIVALSANNLDEDRRRSLQNGLNEHIAKPIAVGSFLQTVEDFLEESSREQD